ncbi:MAG: hypothetical protein M3O29_04340 [Actinomycetota bacterium]|nr:hypothetical protein [Actinomycetota bacterium]
MTAAEYIALAAELEQETILVQGVTAQQKLRGMVFDYNAPLPDLHITQARSWEPAARRYRDLEPTEKEANA